MKKDQTKKALLEGLRLGEDLIPGSGSPMSWGQFLTRLKNILRMGLCQQWGIQVKQPDEGVLCFEDRKSKVKLSVTFCFEDRKSFSLRNYFQHFSVER